MTHADVTAGVSTGELDRLLAGLHHDPHSILGAHPGDGGITVRALRPLATSVTVLLPDGQRFPMEHVHGGVVAAVLPAGPAGPGRVPGYRLAVTYPGQDAGAARLGGAPYRPQPTGGAVR
jgi:1,4-alpha-glucan branching enzyme